MRILSASTRKEREIRFPDTIKVLSEKEEICACSYLTGIWREEVGSFNFSSLVR
ncbi:MAG TPA: hypothetical protein PLJ96_03250 [Candidatus Atribacteria bacterium]|nr:hypothetical protein [Candidatus Atribacteria bacterium]